MGGPPPLNCSQKAALTANAPIRKRMMPARKRYVKLYSDATPSYPRFRSSLGRQHPLCAAADRDVSWPEY